jgi:TatD DNase family protein
MTRYFDSHCHLADDQLWPEVDNVIERARRVNVSRWLSICTGQETLKRNLELQQRTPGLYLAAAVHPDDVSNEGEAGFAAVERVIDQLVAIGETGLDYFHGAPEVRPLQHQYLSRFCDLALRHNLPVIIHSRDCYDDLVAALKPYASACTRSPGIIHCFTGTWRQRP